MKRTPFLASRLVAPLAVIGWLAVPLAAAAQNTENNAQVAIPALDGLGLASLAGILSIGGAWWLSRRGDKDK